MSEPTPELILKHELLDAQHGEVFRRLANLSDALAGPREGLEPALAALADALVTHLASEEQLMLDAGYPERTRHKSAHELFMADFLQMRQTLRDEGPTPGIVDWIQRRIPEWLRFHISVNDFPLAVFLARRRAQPPAPGASRDGGRRLS
jgi:hemerythrin-like metal-binding protein